MCRVEQRMDCSDLLPGVEDAGCEQDQDGWNENSRDARHERTQRRKTRLARQCERGRKEQAQLKQPADPERGGDEVQGIHRDRQNRRHTRAGRMARKRHGDEQQQSDEHRQPESGAAIEKDPEQRAERELEPPERGKPTAEENLAEDRTRQRLRHRQLGNRFGLCGGEQALRRQEESRGAQHHRSVQGRGYADARRPKPPFSKRASTTTRNSAVPVMPRSASRPSHRATISIKETGGFPAPRS